MVEDGGGGVGGGAGGGPPPAGNGSGVSAKKGKEAKVKVGKEKSSKCKGGDSTDHCAYKGPGGEDGPFPGTESAEEDDRQTKSAAGGRGRRRRAPNSAHAQLFDGGLQCSSSEEDSVIGEEQLLGGIQVELEPIGKLSN